MSASSTIFSLTISSVIDSGELLMYIRGCTCLWKFKLHVMSKDLNSIQFSIPSQKTSSSMSVIIVNVLLSWQPAEGTLSQTENISVVTETCVCGPCRVPESRSAVVISNLQGLLAYPSVVGMARCIHPAAKLCLGCVYVSAVLSPLVWHAPIVRLTAAISPLKPVPVHGFISLPRDIISVSSAGI